MSCPPPPIPAPRLLFFTVVFLEPQAQRYPDLQYLLTRMLKVAFLLDTVSAGPSSSRTALWPRGPLS